MSEGGRSTSQNHDKYGLGSPSFKRVRGTLSLNSDPCEKSAPVVPGEKPAVQVSVEHMPELAPAQDSAALQEQGPSESDLVSNEDALKFLKGSSNEPLSVDESPICLPKTFGTDGLLLIELCAGTAIVSRTAQSLHVRTLAIDHDRERAPWKGCVMLDLADPVQVKSLCQLVTAERDRILAIFAAPPCGTASRARERPLKTFAKMGFRIPRPLRSDEHPDMIPGITGNDRTKVELANQLYDQLTEIFLHALAHEILCVIENPQNSLYWSTSFFRRLHEAFPDLGRRLTTAAMGETAQRGHLFGAAQMGF